MTVKDNGERPLTPAEARAVHRGHLSEDEVLKFMRWALEDCAEWWAGRGGKPEDIAKMLFVYVKECGEPPFVSPVEVRRIASKGFMNLIQKHKGYVQDVGNESLAGPTDIAASIDEMESWIDFRAEQFHFGIEKLDEAIGGGVMKGQLLSLIGNPGSMKTSLLLNGIERWVDESSEPAALFSLDMDKAAIFERFMLREMRCGREVLRSHYLGKSPQYAAAKEALGRRLSGRLSVLENQGSKRWTIDKIKEYIEFNTPGLVAIDYMTLLKKPRQSDYDTVNEAVPILKDLARFYGCAIVMLSQMSIASRKEQASGGAGGSARGGGIINEIVDIELELFRDVSRNPLDALPKIVATITKTRMGIAGASYQLEYSGPKMVFLGGAERVHRAVARKPVFDTV